MSAQYNSKMQLVFNGQGQDSIKSNVVDAFNFGSSGFPDLTINRGSDTGTYTTLPTIGHYNDTLTIAKTSSITIDFSTAIDRATGAKLAGTLPLKVIQACIAIISPDGVKTIRIGQGDDTDAVGFNLGTTGTNPEKVYTDRTHHYVFEDHYNGSSGKKIIIKNPSNTALDCAVTLVLAD